MVSRRVLRYSAAAVVTVVVIVAASVYFALRASLPRLDGEVSTEQLRAAASIERDAQGTPTVRAATRRDLAFATGYAHAQDRFFQMDLMRRAAAGELAELLGPTLIDTDRKFRVHGFRKVAEQVVDQAGDANREILDAYVAGGNLALEHASARPCEYLVLRTQPAPWRRGDPVLVAFSSYFHLNDSSGEEELARSQLRDSLPPALFAFMHPLGSEWDAPVVGGRWSGAPVPASDVIDLRA